MQRPLKRQGSLDALRGLAALQVMIAHYICTFYPYGVFGDRDGHVRRAAWEALLFFPPFGLLTAGNFAVCLFFLLSGYVLSYPYLEEPHRFQRIGSAMIKRPIRLGGLVLFTTVVSAMLWVGQCYFNSEVSNLTGARPWFDAPWRGDFEPERLLANICTALFTQAGFYNPPLWTIKIELYGSMYVLVFLMFFGACRCRLILVLLLLIVLRNSPYFGFFAGLLMADLVKNNSVEIRGWFGKAVSVLVLIGAIYFSSYPSYVQPDFLQSTIYGKLPHRAAMFVGYPMLAAALVFGLLVVSRTLQRLLMRPSLLWLGRISYALYAVHFLLLGSLTSWLFLALKPLFGYNLAVLLVVAVSFPLTMLLSYWMTILVDLPAARLGQCVGHQVMAWGVAITRRLGTRDHQR